MQRIILWLRNDLRLHDNYVIQLALRAKEKKHKYEVLPVFCFDPRIYGDVTTPYGTRKTGLLRTRFILETVQELRENLKAIGSNLLVSRDKPEVFLPKLLDEDSENRLVFQKQICYEELKVEHAVKAALQKQALKNLDLKPVQINEVWGSTLYHIDDLQFKPIQYLPHIYGKFREKTQKVKVRPLAPTPQDGDLPFPEEESKVIDRACQFLPELEDFGFQEQEIKEMRADPRACLKFKGGESKGLKRLEEYVFKQKSVGHYNDTRNQLLGSEYSSKLGPWISSGALSIRKIYHAVRQYEKKYKPDIQIKTYIDELFWRDYYRYWCMHYGNQVFSEYGIYKRTYYNWQQDPEIYKRWKEGKTGMPLIDALMRDMNRTGFMPNRGRMIVACYFSQDLKQDWRYGAHYFEERLIDYDVHSNYGGWAFSSGIGPGRVLVFNSMKQSHDYDKLGHYIKSWVPELRPVPVDYVHDPWNLPLKRQKQSSFVPGKNYPVPIQCEKYTSAQAAKKYKRVGSEVVAQQAKLVDMFKKEVTAEESQLQKRKEKKKEAQDKLSKRLRSS